MLQAGQQRGKSTFAKWLSQESKIALVSKDGIREELFDRLGWKDREWAQNLGKASIDMMFYFADAQLAVGQSIIMDNTFHPAVSTERFLALKKQFHAESIQIICDAKDEILFERFKSRPETGKRHPGHGDEIVLLGLREFLSSGYSPFLEIDGPVIEVNTDDFITIDYQAILRDIRRFASQTPKI